jgi:chaperone modulatory protein CbpM
MAFREVDFARVRLICDIHYNLMIDKKALSLVLSLLDQIYSLRRELNAVKEALDSQPHRYTKRSVGGLWRAPSEPVRGAGAPRTPRAPLPLHRQAASPVRPP